MKTRAGRSAPAKPAPRAGRAASRGAQEEVFLPFGAAHTVALDLPEFRPLVDRLQLPSPNRLSPLPGLMAPGSRGQVRDVDEILGRLARQDQDTLTWMFSPLAVPDRILELRGASFNSAPQLCSLYANRWFKDFFAGVRPALVTDYELLAPFTTVDLEVWTRIQTQLSSAQNVPPPTENPSGADLAFLFLLADAHKAAFANTWRDRHDDPVPVLISTADIMSAQDAAAKSRDRRWSARAIGELFSAMIHPGGATGIGLPRLDDSTVTAMVQSYSQQGMLKVSGSGREQRFELGTGLGLWAGSLFSWLNLMSLHDTQVVGFEGGRPKAAEDCVILITTDPVVWVIASDGLGGAGSDVGNVRFVLRSMSVPSACSLVAKFVTAMPDISLPGELYEPVGGAASDAPAPAAASAPPAPPRRRAKAPVWTPTHTIPEGGLDAWEEPNPDLEPVAELEEGLEVQVTEEVGAWAHVVCDNGWEGWTDARELVPR